MLSKEIDSMFLHHTLITKLSEHLVHFDQMLPENGRLAPSLFLFFISIFSFLHQYLQRQCEGGKIENEARQFSLSVSSEAMRRRKD